jgi:hypothetical protein
MAGKCKHKTLELPYLVKTFRDYYDVKIYTIPELQNEFDCQIKPDGIQLTFMLSASPKEEKENIADLGLISEDLWGNGMMFIKLLDPGHAEQIKTDSDRYILLRVLRIGNSTKMSIK